MNFEFRDDKIQNNEIESVYFYFPSVHASDRTIATVFSRPDLGLAGPPYNTAETLQGNYICYGESVTVGATSMYSCVRDIYRVCIELPGERTIRSVDQPDGALALFVSTYKKSTIVTFTHWCAHCVAGLLQFRGPTNRVVETGKAVFQNT